MKKEELVLEIEKVDTELAQYDEIMNKVKVLQNRKKDLKKKVEKLEEKELGFLELFSKWQGKNGGSHDRWIPDEEHYPNLRELMESKWLNRYETYDLKDCSWFDSVDYLMDFEFNDKEPNLKKMSYDKLVEFLENTSELYEQLDEELGDAKYDDERYDEELDDLFSEDYDLFTTLAAAKEVMEDNLASFKYDW